MCHLPVMQLPNYCQCFHNILTSELHTHTHTQLAQWDFPVQGKFHRLLKGSRFSRVLSLYLIKHDPHRTFNNLKPPYCIYYFLLQSAVFPLLQHLANWCFVRWQKVEPNSCHTSGSVTVPENDSLTSSITSMYSPTSSFVPVLAWLPVKHFRGNSHRQIMLCAGRGTQYGTLGHIQTLLYRNPDPE